MPTRVLRTTSLFVLALAACGSLAARAQSCPTGTPSANASVGTICGTTVQAGGKQISAYLGIPYAQAPLNDPNNPAHQFRWKAPQPLNNLPRNPFLATQLGCICPQPLQNPGNCTTTSPTVPPGYCSNPAQAQPFSQSEDCLTLNIWTPGSATQGSKLPVMVFIHGGAFVNGSGEGSMYDGSSVAANGNVLVVTFNYRLGALGFLPANGDNNFGLQDQVQALTWVKNNITSFGGDPNRITLFGESAGAMSVGLLTLSLSSSQPALFQAAIMESNPLGIPYKGLIDAQTMAGAFAKTMKCPLFGYGPCMGQVPASNIVAQENGFVQEISALIGLQNVMAWSPIINGTLLSGVQPIAAAQAGKLTIPLIVGTNQSEGNLFANLVTQGKPFASSSYKLAVTDLFKGNATKILQNPTYACSSSATDCTQQLQAVINDYAFTCANRFLAKQAKNANTYVYQFTQTDYNLWPCVKACNGAACHGDEIPFVFNTFNPALQNPSPGDQTLSALMGSYWTNFATRQNPNAASLFQWPAFGSASSYMFLNATPSSAADPLDASANCDSLWNDIGYETSMSWSNLLKAVEK